MDYHLLDTSPGTGSVQGEPSGLPGKFTSPAVFPTPYRETEGDIPVPEGKASICSTILNLFSTITGAGMLGLPYAFANSGVAMGLVWFFLTGFGESYAIHLLGKCILKERKYSFRALIKKTLNFKGNEYFINGIMALNCFGYCCGYVIVCGELFPDIVRYLFKSESHSVLTNRVFWISIMVWVLALPLVCLKSLEMLKFTSALGFMGITYVATMTVLYAFAGDLLGDACSGQDESCPGDFYWFFPGSVSDLLRVISMFCYAFVCTQNIPTLAFELKDRSITRLNIAVNGAIGLAIGFYFLTALSAYLVFGSIVKSDMLVSFPKNTYTSIARLGIAIAVCTTFPLQMFPTKNAVCNIIFGKDARDCNRKQYYGMILGLMASAWAIGVLIKDLSIVLTLIGATTSMFIGYTFPAYFYIKLFREEGFTFDKFMSYVIFVASLILAPLLVGVEIYSLTSKARKS